MTTERRTNDSPLRNGQLDEKLNNFRLVSISERVAAIAFQFETGGFMAQLGADMTMTELADRLDGMAATVRKYQREGWPMQKVSIDGREN